MDPRLKEQHKAGRQKALGAFRKLQVTGDAAGDRGWIMKTSGTRLKSSVFS